MYRDNINWIKNYTNENQDELSASEVKEIGEIKETDTIGKLKYDNVYVLDNRWSIESSTVEIHIYSKWYSSKERQDIVCCGNWITKISLHSAQLLSASGSLRVGEGRLTYVN